MRSENSIRDDYNILKAHNNDNNDHNYSNHCDCGTAAKTLPYGMQIFHNKKWFPHSHSLYTLATKPIGIFEETHRKPSFRLTIIHLSLVVRL